MLFYCLRKILFLLASMFVLISLTFVLMKAIPGDPFSQEQSLTTQGHAALMKHHGLDQSYLKQYGHYLSEIFHGNLGTSLIYHGRTVNQLIHEGFPISAYLGAQALLVSIGLSIVLGLISALRPHSWSDQLIQIGMALGISIPSFILATILQYVLSVKWQLLPLARWGTFSHTILPTLTLAALPTAFMTRLIRTNILEVLQMDYIKTAKAKGLHPIYIFWRHALRNALLPVLSYLGPLASVLLIGSFIIENIFSIPGLGQWYVNSVVNRDYPLIMGLTLFYALLLMMLNFIVDIAYGFLDPRIRILSAET